MAESRQSECGADAVAAARENPSQLLRAVLESVAEAAVVVNDTGQVVFAHPVAAPVLRSALVPARPAAEPPAYELYLPDRSTIYPPGSLPLARALRGETVERQQVFAREAGDREGIWLSISASPICDESGQVRGAFAVVREIAMRRQFRPCSRDEECFRTLIENGVDIVFVLDAYAAIRYSSPSAGLVLEYQPQELIGRSAFELVHPQDLPAVRAAFDAALADPVARIRAEFRCRHQDGSWRHLEGVAKRLPSGAFADAVVVNARDVTERKRSEAAIHFHASLLDQVRNAVVATDASGEIIYWNRFAEELYQWKREEVLGKRAQDVTLAAAGKREVEAAFRQARECGHYEGELIKRRKDGTTFPASVTASAIRDGQGSIVGFVAITVDVTERKLAEAKLKESGEQLRRLAARLQAVRERERAIVSQDIQDQLGQSLAALNIGLSETFGALARGASNDAIAARLATASSLLQGAIESVQRISGELRPSLLDNLGLGAAVASYACEFQERTGLRCICAASEEVRAAPNVSIAVYRIFQEALNNIARHARATEVRVRLLRRGGRLVLRVHDNGRGISAQETASRASLGLLEMRERARLVGGTIAFRRSKGGGTTVWLKVRAE